MTSRAIVGIDPGQSGGCALVGLNREVLEVHKMPETVHGLAVLLARLQQTTRLAIVESVQAMPGSFRGTVGSFKLGRHFGAILGVLAAQGWQIRLVTPVTWQRALGCLTKGDKRITRALAAEWFPTVKATHAISDALLLATYGHDLVHTNQQGESTWRRKQ